MKYTLLYLIFAYNFWNIIKQSSENSDNFYKTQTWMNRYFQNLDSSIGSWVVCSLKNKSMQDNIKRQCRRFTGNRPGSWRRGCGSSRRCLGRTWEKRTIFFLYCRHAFYYITTTKNKTSQKELLFYQSLYLFCFLNIISEKLYLSLNAIVQPSTPCRRRTREHKHTTFLWPINVH